MPPKVTPTGKSDGKQDEGAGPIPGSEGGAEGAGASPPPEAGAQPSEGAGAQPPEPPKKQVQAQKPERREPRNVVARMPVVADHEVELYLQAAYDNGLKVLGVTGSHGRISVYVVAEGCDPAKTRAQTGDEIRKVLEAGRDQLAAET